MKLYGSLTSPFVRAVRIAAIELGLDGEIELTRTVVKPTEPNRTFGDAVNPLRRVPALEGRNGALLVDSRVIIDYLNGLGAGGIIPAGEEERIDSLNRHAVVSGATEALVLAMYENRLRPENLRWKAWSDDQVDKADHALAWADARIERFATHFDIASIGLVCLVGYARFRFPDRDWMQGRPSLAAYIDDTALRPSVAETAPRE